VKRKIFSSTYLMADETGIRVLDRNKKGKTHKGWYWVYHDTFRPMATKSMTDLKHAKTLPCYVAGHMRAGILSSH